MRFYELGAWNCSLSYQNTAQKFVWGAEIRLLVTIKAQLPNSFVEVSRVFGVSLLAIETAGSS
jgi:hypothetical protein